MILKLSMRAAWMLALAGVLGLVSATASAAPVTVTPKFRFLNFYANGLYASTAPDNVDYFVNDSRVWFKNSVSFTSGPAHDISSIPSDRFLFGTLSFTSRSWATMTNMRVDFAYRADGPQGGSLRAFEFPM